MSHQASTISNMQTDSVHRRRMSYQRSHTLSTLPTHLVQEVEQEQEDEDSINEHSKLISTKDSPLHHLSGSTSELDRLVASDIDDDLTLSGVITDSQNNQNLQDSGQLNMLAGATGGGQRSGNGILRSLSGSSNDTKVSASSSHSKKLGRTPSTPSIILNKVKDRIREKVFQTSQEWPHAAAIIQERRQRSVTAFEARMTKSRKSLEKDDIEVEQIPLKDLHSKKKRARMKSDPIPAVVLTNVNDEIGPHEAARLAFRRRSISEDTYDRRPCLPKVIVDRPENTAGIICSNEDLKALGALAEPSGRGRKKSPQPKKRSSLEPQGSVESSSSTYSSRSARSSRAYSMGDVESPCDRPDTLALHSRNEQVNSSNNSLSVAGASAVSSPQYPETSLERKYKDRSASVTSANSAGPLHYLSNAGSKSSFTDRRASDYSTKNSSRRTSNSTGLIENDPDDDGCDKITAVPEVVFDEFGQTWDVYGAEFDPEMVGDAIQRHLVKIMQRKAEDLQSGKDEKDNHERKDGSRRDSMGFLLRFLCLYHNRDQPSTP